MYVHTSLCIVSKNTQPPYFCDVIYECPLTVHDSLNFAQSCPLFHKYRISLVPDSIRNTTRLDGNDLDQQNAENNGKKNLKLKDFRGDLDYFAFILCLFPPPPPFHFKRSSYYFVCSNTMFLRISHLHLQTMFSS